ncbi:MAG: sodium:solute symporter [Sedimentisphaeraceae bacterium JB056]
MKKLIISLLLLFSSVVFASNNFKVTQHDGFDNIGYEFGASGILKFASGYEEQPEIVSDISLDVKNAVAFGQSDIAIFCDDGTIYCFNAITETLRVLERPENLTPDMDANLTTDQVLKFLGSSKPNFGLLNYTVLGVYLAILVGMGFYFSKHEKSTDDFFLAGRRIPSWAAGLSIFGTQLSAITFMAVPAKAYSSNWQYFLGNIAIVLVAAPVAAFIFIPFYRRLNITTAYEYLEKRFNLAVRLFASAIYIVMQLLRMGIVLFLPALALSTVSGIDVRLTILLMGILCTIYTVLGGIEAVIWTDVVQVIVLLAGALLCLFVIIADVGHDVVGMTQVVYEQGKLSLGDMRLDFSSPTLIVVLIMMPSMFCPYVTDQTVVQRYLTTKDEKQAKKSLWINAWMTIPATVLFFSLGTFLYMFYCDNPEKLDAGMSNDSILPWFVLQELPAGISGLLIAGVFAAAMSSLDSSMNSVSAAIVSDFVVRFKSSISEHRRLVLARILTVILGAFGTITALVMTAYDIKSFWDCMVKVVNPFLGALGGLFLLGAITKKCNATGGLTGIILGVVVLYIIQAETSLHFFLYMPIAVVVTFVIGFIVSLVTGSNKKDMTNLTLTTMVETEN